MTDDPSIWRRSQSLSGAVPAFRPEKLVFYEDPLLPLSRLYSVEARLSEALDRKVWLKSGGYLVIDKTEALTCIDVNSGKYTGKKRGSAEETYFHINMEAAQKSAINFCSAIFQALSLLILSIWKQSAKTKCCWNLCAGFWKKIRSELP